MQARSAARSPASKGIGKRTQEQPRRRPVKQRTEYARNRDAKAAAAKTAAATAAAAEAKAAKEKKKAEKVTRFKSGSTKPAPRKRRRKDGPDECDAQSKAARRK